MFKLKNKEKRAQSEIISTVLIILLILAAVIIIWQVVSSTTDEGEKSVNLADDCSGVIVKLVKAKAENGTTSGEISLRRDSNEPKGKNLTIIVLVDGERIREGVTLDKYETKKVYINATDPDLNVSKKIAVTYAINGQACPNDPEVLGEVKD